jgi:hypothetical protein
MWEKVKRWFLGDDRELHEKYPQILHWEKGDRFDAPLSTNLWQLVSLSADGKVYVQELLGDMGKYNLSYFYKTYTNTSLRNRNINEEIKNSQEYMTLLSNFQQSVKELRERDVKQIGEPIKDYLDKRYKESLALNGGRE